MSVPAVFLDRDGVLNHVVLRDGKPYAPAFAKDLNVVRSAIPACAQLSAAGYVLVGVTNQPDVSRGTTTREQVDAINDMLVQSMGLKGIRVCFHDDSDDCYCRKPKPGLLLEAARDFDIDLANSIMVGDRWKDMEAGIDAGCRTVFIDQNYAEQRPATFDFSAPDLQGAVAWIIDNKGN
jgi:D-glycero-D-manno-heptose 1,7-bisphosphate phosphatase